MEDFGFVLLRCVKTKEHNVCWQTCYQSIRQFHNDKIMIVDDNSNNELISNLDSNEKELVNVEIVHSEYPGSGELLPYYYLNKLKIFKKAFILQDTMFLRAPLPPSVAMYDESKPIKYLFDCYYQQYDDPIGEKYLLSKLNPEYSDKLIEFYDSKDKWRLCFGVCSIVNLNFIELLDTKYNFFNLIHHINKRHDRCCLERVLGLLCFYEKATNFDESEFGNVFLHEPAYDRPGFNTQDYLQNITQYKNLRIIKIFRGR